MTIGGAYLGPVGSMWPFLSAWALTCSAADLSNPKIAVICLPEPKSDPWKDWGGKTVFAQVQFLLTSFPIIASHSFKGMGKILDPQKKYPYGAYKKSFDPEYVMEMQLKVSFWVS